MAGFISNPSAPPPPARAHSGALTVSVNCVHEYGRGVSASDLLGVNVLGATWYSRSPLPNLRDGNWHQVHTTWTSMTGVRLYVLVQIVLLLLLWLFHTWSASHQLNKSPQCKTVLGSDYAWWR